MKTYVHKKTYILLLIASSLVIVKNLLTTTVSPNRWMVKLWYSHTVEYYSSIKRNASNNLDGFQRWYAEWETPVSRGQITYYLSVQFSSVTQSCPTLGDPMNCSTPGLPVHHQLPKSTQTHVHWVSDAVQPSHPLSSSSCPQSFPAPGSFPISQFFASDGQSIGVSASASVFPVNTQDWFPLGWTGCIFLLSKGLSRVFSNTTDLKLQFFGAQLSLQSNFHIHTWLLEKP